MGVLLNSSHGKLPLDNDNPADCFVSERRLTRADRCRNEADQTVLTGTILISLESMIFVHHTDRILFEDNEKKKNVGNSRKFPFNRFFPSSSMAKSA